MAKFLDIHAGCVGQTQAQLEAALDDCLDVEAAEGVRFERRWLDPEFGKAFCLTTAPSKEAVRRVHEAAGQPAGEVYEISGEAGASR